MDIDQALRMGVQRLHQCGVDEPRRDVEILLEELLGVGRAEIYLKRRSALSPEQRQRFMDWLAQRVNRVPVQYIINKAWFMDLELYVDENVLIPRPDTEILVESIIKAAEDMPRPLRALDIGTGSGAIAISLALHIDQCIVWATDISPCALDVARKNVERYGVQQCVKLLQGDLLEPVKGMSFHIIASNPPYIPSGDIEELQPEVRCFEPRNALDGGIDGLDFYRRISAGLIDVLEPDGLLALEIGYDQAHEVSAMLERAGMKGICVLKDLSGFDRVVLARR